MSENISTVQKNGKARKLKVYSKMLPRVDGMISVPEIRLCGRWLEKSGFVEGSDVLVTFDAEGLNIKLCVPQP